MWCCVVACHAEKNLRAHVQHASVCTVKTSPCMPATRAQTFSKCARVAGTHGDVLSVNTEAC